MLEISNGKHEVFSVLDAWRLLFCICIQHVTNLGLFFQDRFNVGYSFDSSNLKEKK